MSPEEFRIQNSEEMDSLADKSFWILNSGF